MNLGDEVDVKIIEVDREGRVRLSRKALLPKPEGYEERPPREGGGDRDRGDRGGRGGDRGGRGGGGGRGGFRR
jgi:polyribonucleotide nucleotidyltransferase